MSDLVRTKALTFPAQDNQLAAKLHTCQNAIKARVIIAHGLFSSMASEKLTSLALFLCREGFCVLQFDHSGCGESTGDIRETTLTSRRDEYLAAVEALPGGDAPLVYIGSSMGGTAAGMAADVTPPACTVHWSAPWDYFDLMKRISSQDDAPDLPLMPRDIARHDLEGILGRLRNACFIHGSEDEVVPVAQAQRGYQLAREPKDLLVIHGADHRISRPDDQREAFTHTLAWINRFIDS